MFRNDRAVPVAIDRGADCPPITAPGQSESGRQRPVPVLLVRGHGQLTPARTPAPLCRMHGSGVYSARRPGAAGTGHPTHRWRDTSLMGHPTADDAPGPDGPAQGLIRGLLAQGVDVLR